MTEYIIKQFPGHLDADERKAVLRQEADRLSEWMLSEADKALGRSERHAATPMSLAMSLHAVETVQTKWQSERIEALEAKLAQLEAKVAVVKPKAKP